jgi:hypothetical protein
LFDDGSARALLELLPLLAAYRTGGGKDRRSSAFPPFWRWVGVLCAAGPSFCRLKLWGSLESRRRQKAG